MARFDRSMFLDGSGKEVVVQLFKEFKRYDTKFTPPFTLKQWKDIFLEVKDPTEYAFAMETVGDWDHWQRIRNHVNIKPHVDRWQQELAIKLKSEAVQQMKKLATQPGGTAAAKWLADKGYTQEETRKVGRPSSKTEQPPEDHSVRMAKDAARLGLVVGGKK
jgi:hypothetical protein